MSEQDEYTPSVEQARDSYVYSMMGYDGSISSSEYKLRAEFDRLIAQVRREAAAEALEDAAKTYRDGQVTGVFYGRNDYTKAWLAQRAAVIREQGTVSEPSESGEQR